MLFRTCLNPSPIFEGEGVSIVGQNSGLLLSGSVSLPMREGFLKLRTHDLRHRILNKALFVDTAESDFRWRVWNLLPLWAKIHCFLHLS